MWWQGRELKDTKRDQHSHVCEAVAGAAVVAVVVVGVDAAAVLLVEERVERGDLPSPIVVGVVAIVVAVIVDFDFGLSWQPVRVASDAPHKIAVWKFVLCTQRTRSCKA